MAYMVYSNASSKKIMHYSHCCKVKQISKKHKNIFQSETEGLENNYRYCKYCNPMIGVYRKERKKIDDICRKNNLTFFIENKTIHILSQNGCWRIIRNGREHRLFLYHKDSFCRNYKRGLIPGYHSQKIRSNTVEGYLKYIVEHDNYRSEHKVTENFIFDNKVVREEKEWKPELLNKYGINTVSEIRKDKPMGKKKKKKVERKRKAAQRIADANHVISIINELIKMEESRN